MLVGGEAPDIVPPLPPVREVESRADAAPATPPVLQEAKRAPAPAFSPPSPPAPAVPARADGTEESAMKIADYLWSLYHNDPTADAALGHLRLKHLLGDSPAPMGVILSPKEITCVTQDFPAMLKATYPDGFPDVLTSLVVQATMMPMSWFLGTCGVIKNIALQAAAWVACYGPAAGRVLEMLLENFAPFSLDQEEDKPPEEKEASSATSFHIVRRRRALSPYQLNAVWQVAVDGACMCGLEQASGLKGDFPRLKCRGICGRLGSPAPNSWRNDFQQTVQGVTGGSPSGDLE